VGYDEAMRFRLRTLLIILALGPPLVAHLGRPLAYRLLFGPLIIEAISGHDRRLDLADK
jgi:hypothetical protein